MSHFNIQAIVAIYGIKNIRVFGEGSVTMSTFPYDSVPGQMVEYRLTEDRYSMKERYKVSLYPCKNNGICARGIQNPEHHYIGDFNSLVKDQVYRVYVLDSDGYTLVSPPPTITSESDEVDIFITFMTAIKNLVKGLKT